MELELELEVVVVDNLQVFGLLISLLGLFIRHLAMKTCGLSFNHYLITLIQV